jgi:hypothetical protein
MAAAEVGDEQRRGIRPCWRSKSGPPPTWAREAVYLPTATMANQIALAILESGEPS